MKIACHRNPDRCYRFLWVALVPFSGFLALVRGLFHTPLPWRLDFLWVPSLETAFTLRIDGLSALFLSLITGIGSLVCVYASGYFTHEPCRGRLFSTLIAFMLAMAGAVAADHLVVLFVFWELTSITSFLLVGFYREKAAARNAARQALLVTLNGGLGLLAGILLLGDIAGTFSLERITAQGMALTGDRRLPAALFLILFGCCTKSAQFPFHFWLPNAMSAPTPVSAYLHSATLVKLGIYLMARLDAGFNHFWLWESTLVTVGMLTALWGALLALRQRDLKRILAGSTISALGTMTLLTGLTNPGSSLAMVALLFAHALYKAPLFMVVGSIDHATGTRLICRLMGLWRAMPWTALAAVLAGISMAGLPLSFGYVAKDLMTTAKTNADLMNVLSHILLFVNATAVAVAAVATVRVFGGPPEWSKDDIHEVPLRMVLPPIVIALVGLELEFMPDIADPLILAAARAISPELIVMEVEASYTFGKLFTAAEITVLVGIALFFLWDRLYPLLKPTRVIDRVGTNALYQYSLDALPRIAAWMTRFLQHGRPAGYLAAALGGILFLAAGAGLMLEGPFVDASALFKMGKWPEQAWAWITAAVLILSGAGASLKVRGRMALIMTSGIVGYGSAVLFLFTGAPDLAFTQFTVETILVVVAAAVLPHYGPPPEIKREPHGRKALLSVASGAGVLFLLLGMLALPPDTALTRWFGEASLAEAHGRNVVNVIIVDFRSMDTLGEITVVVFSFLSALPLLSALGGFRKKGTS